MTTFKKGDVVRCVDDGGDNYYLTNGRLYTVADGGEGYVQVVEDNRGRSEEFRVSRFVLADVLADPPPPAADSPYPALGAEIGRLVESKQAAYGDSFGRAGAVLRTLYPDGIPPAAYDDMLAVVRVVDKLFRVATAGAKGAGDLGGESPWRDVAGYGLLGAARAAGGEKK